MNYREREMRAQLGTNPGSRIWSVLSIGCWIVLFVGCMIGLTTCINDDDFRVVGPFPGKVMYRVALATPAQLETPMQIPANEMVQPLERPVETKEQEGTCVIHVYLRKPEMESRLQKAKALLRLEASKRISKYSINPDGEIFIPGEAGMPGCTIKIHELSKHREVGPAAGTRVAAYPEARRIASLLMLYYS